MKTLTITENNTSFQSRLCYTLVADILKQVEIELLEVKSIRFLCDYPWTPGKRLRPITFLLAYLSVAVEQKRPIHLDGRESRLAAAIELLHEASLVHDDLVDRSEIRRGVPSMQMHSGQGLALLIGDYMVFRGLKLILDAASSREDILLAQELANTGLNIAHGEADQLDRYLRQQDWDERMSMENYLDIIAKKTAAFFAGCAEGGAALAGAARPLREIYRAFGLNLGLVFQMVDDLMDVVGDAKLARKTLRNNLTEGTVTLPMIQACQLYPDDPALRQLAAGEPLDAKMQSGLYRKCSGPEVLRLCVETMDHYSREAEKYLWQMPTNIYRLALADLFDYIKTCPWGGLTKKLSPKRRKSS
jgi:octaprenyl-diphosphate synthase